MIINVKLLAFINHLKKILSIATAVIIIVPLKYTCFLLDLLRSLLFKILASWVLADLLQFTALLLIDVTLNKLSNLSEPQFPPL